MTFWLNDALDWDDLSPAQQVLWRTGKKAFTEAAAKLRSFDAYGHLKKLVHREKEWQRMEDEQKKGRHKARIITKVNYDSNGKKYSKLYHDPVTEAFMLYDNASKEWGEMVQLWHEHAGRYDWLNWFKRLEHGEMIAHIEALEGKPKAKPKDELKLPMWCRLVLWLAPAESEPRDKPKRKELSAEKQFAENMKKPKYKVATQIATLNGNTATAEKIERIAKQLEALERTKDRFHG